MTVVEQKKTENYSSPELLSIRATFCTRQMLLWEKKRGDSKGSRAFFFCTPPITCHHSKLIMSWKLSPRKTAELGFHSAFHPLPFFFSHSFNFSPLLSPTLTSFCLFISVRSLIHSYTIHICAFLYYSPSLCFLFIPPAPFLFSPVS